MTVNEYIQRTGQLFKEWEIGLLTDDEFWEMNSDDAIKVLGARARARRESAQKEVK